MFRKTNITKLKSSIEYLGCNGEYFKEFITRKMVPGMNWDNIHLDHIKPVVAFNLEDHEQFLDCCHYSNFQPLFAIDNLEKNGKWNDEAEAFWREHIRIQEYTEIYNPFAVLTDSTSLADSTADGNL